MELEKLLTGLFDYQRFERDPALERVILDAQEGYLSQELSDEALNLISAAGDPFLQMPEPPTEREGPL